MLVQMKWPVEKKNVVIEGQGCLFAKKMKRDLASIETKMLNRGKKRKKLTRW